jgi:hypothetical protein
MPRKTKIDIPRNSGTGAKKQKIAGDSAVPIRYSRTANEKQSVKTGSDVSLAILLFSPLICSRIANTVQAQKC